MINAQHNPNPATTFDQLWKILAELQQKLNHHFELHPTPAEQPLETFTNSDGSISGRLNTFSSPEIEWLVCSCLQNPQGFSTMRLTTWLSSRIDVPHLVFEFGTMPSVFFYIDYLPRVDIWTDLSYLERYYEPVNPTYLKLRDHPQLSLFVSKGLYVRQVQSPVNLCYTCFNAEEGVPLIRAIAHEMIDRWLGWVDTATPVAPEAQPSLAARDLQMRRIAAERDPGNQMASKLLGSELASRLIGALWGANLL